MKYFASVVALCVALTACGGGQDLATCQPVLDEAPTGKYRDIDFEIRGSLWENWFEAEEDGRRPGEIWLQYHELDAEGVVVSDSTRTYSSFSGGSNDQNVMWDEVTDDLEVRECTVIVIRRDSSVGQVLWER